jgi:hypothetical protein
VVVKSATEIRERRKRGQTSKPNPSPACEKKDPITFNSPPNLQNDAASTFKVDEEVDALCTLPNGTTRWFPGVIIAVSGGKYEVKCSDGEIVRKV